MEQDKLKIIARATRKFMGTANRLVDATAATAKYAAGSRGAVKAAARKQKCDAEYEAAYNALDSIIDELG